MRGSKTRFLSKVLMLGISLMASTSFIGLAQVAPLDRGLEADAGRGILTQRTGALETQQTCPQRVGDAWDLTSESSWNVLEVGIQVNPADFPSPKFQAYTRYTCDAPFDRPRSSAIR
jgi:hypothetical protein